MEMLELVMAGCERNRRFGKWQSFVLLIHLLLLLSSPTRRFLLVHRQRRRPSTVVNMDVMKAFWKDLRAGISIECVCVCVYADVCQPKRRRFWKQIWYISRPVRSISTWEEVKNTKYLFIHIITVLFTCCILFMCEEETWMCRNICTIMSNRLDVCSAGNVNGRTRKRRNGWLQNKTLFGCLVDVKSF